MRSKISILTLCLAFSGLSFHTTPLFAHSSSSIILEAKEDQHSYIYGLASLSFHIKELKDSLDASQEPDGIAFSEEEISLLWDKIAHSLYSQKATTEQIRREYRFEKAQESYHQAKHHLSMGESEQAERLFSDSFNYLSGLWEEAIDRESKQGFDHLNSSGQAASLRVRAQNVDFEKNRVLSNKIKKRMRPYIIPDKHPMKDNLDAIFLRKRATVNEDTFKASGFRIISKRPRSFIYVAKHKSLPTYLVKAYMDDQLKEKRDRPSWEWLVRRCEGADKIRYIINKKQIRFFVVASKWIYPLPADPSPPKDEKHTRHLALLLVTDMNLAPKDLNYYAWQNYITPDHLDELYSILSFAKGSSYRPDNIAYTNQGLFAFIDTEYPSQGPDYKSIRMYLNPDMRAYWDRLVKRGGKH
ncbi:hypothetical protein [Candidatus Protochlamydia phocaeensis]|uniref:hypothetical protein n=1 Tax=Candidatus Protochlamydia phocaeensis TaxID=1414722 RepID=UPI0008387BFD|nr:hypothetical protein [Candidatus Protochlamydia phocaeensis]